MSVTGGPNLRSAQQAASAAKSAATQVAKKAEGAKTQTLEKKSDVKTDLFKGLKDNIFGAFKKALPGLKDAGKKLLDNPDVKAALGKADPSALIDSAKGEAKKLVNEKLAKLESWTPPSKSASADKGTNLPEGMSAKDFVSKGLQGPGDLGIKSTKTGSKEITLSDSQKGAVDKAGAGLGKVQDGFAKAQELAKFAEKLGIKVPEYKKSGEVGTTKNLHTSPDGKGSVDLNANAKGSFTAGVDGIKAQGEAGLNVTATRSDSVSTEGKLGKADASYNATASAGVKATGSATLDQNGLEVKARAEVGVSASVSGQAKVESKDIGGVPGLTAYAGVQGEVKVGANAYAEGTAKLSGNPPTAVIRGEAGAFVGGEATVKARAGLGPVGLEGTASGWVGLGAKAHFDAGYENGKLKLDFGAGAALGYGGFLGGKVEIDVGKAAKIAEHVIDKTGDAIKKGLDVNGDGKIGLDDAKAAIDQAGKTIDKVTTTVGNAVKDGAKTVVNTAGKALDAVGTGISNAGKAISNAGSSVKSFAKKLKFW
jgi:hypothetical protein